MRLAVTKQNERYSQWHFVVDRLRENYEEDNIDERKNGEGITS